MTDNIAVHFFQLTEPEMELANVLIQDGWQGDMYSLIECARMLNSSFDRVDA